MNQFNDQVEDFKRNLDQGLKSAGSILVVLLIALAGWTSFFTVQPDEEAVILRFGRYINTVGPGLHFKAPFGVDQSILVKTKLVHQQEFGFRTISTSGRRTSYSTSNYTDESLMLTGDLNVGEVSWVVQYQISDPYKYKFLLKNPEKTIRDVSESIMRRVVGDKLVSDVLTTGKAQIASDAKTLMQDVLNLYDVGIRIKTVELQDVNPPERVRKSFNEVNEAKQEQEKLINEAEEEYNKVIPRAKGRADETISKAEGYAEALLNRATGDAEKFNDVLRAYKTAPKITKKRIYLETMEKLFQRFEEVTVVDKEVKGLLPVFSKKLSE